MLPCNKPAIHRPLAVAPCPPSRGSVGVPRAGSRVPGRGGDPSSVGVSQGVGGIGGEAVDRGEPGVVGGMLLVGGRGEYPAPEYPPAPVGDAARADDCDASPSRPSPVQLRGSDAVAAGHRVRGVHGDERRGDRLDAAAQGVPGK